MAKGGKLDWKGVSTGTPCAKPEDNRPDYDKPKSVGDWKGLEDTTPNSSGKSQSIKISGGKSED